MRKIKHCPEGNKPLKHLNSWHIPAGVLLYLKTKYKKSVSLREAIRRELDCPSRFWWNVKLERGVGTQVTIRYHKKLTSKQAVEKLIANAKKFGVKIGEKPERIKQNPKHHVWNMAYVPKSIQIYLDKFYPRVALSSAFVQELQLCDAKARIPKPQRERLVPYGAPTKTIRYRYSRKLGSPDAIALIAGRAKANGFIVDTRRPKQHPLW